MNYDECTKNDGDMLDLSTGIVTIPESGEYFFNFWAVAVVKEQEWITVKLYKYVNGNTDQDDQVYTLFNVK